MSELFGLELFFSSRSSELRCKSDALVLAIHWTLVTDGLRSTFGEGEGEVSELLPSGWNEKSEDVYTLRYVRPGKNETFLVKIVFADGILIVNSLKNDKQTASISLTVDNFITDHNAGFRSVYQNLDALQTEIREQLLGIQVSKALPKEPTTHDNSGLVDPNPLGVPSHRRPFPSLNNFPDEDDNGRNRWPDVGRGDLHPLGGPSGMLMDPRSLIQPNRPGNFPRGTIPGARFDPYGPPVPGEERRHNPPFGGPTPDHLPPPGYDDMFL